MKKSCLLLGCLISVSAIAQSKVEKVIDLGAQDPGTTQTEIVEANKVYSFVLKNIVRKYKYNIEFDYKIQPIDPLPIDSLSAFLVERKDKCDSIIEIAINAIKVAKLELEVKKLGEQLEKDLTKKKCKKKDEFMKRFREQTTKRLDYEVEIKKGYELLVTITRTDTNLVWKRRFKTSKRKNWKLFYGFTYVQNWMNPEPTFYSKSDTGSTFSITKHNNLEKDILKNITPTLMYTYTPTNKYSFKKGERIKAVFSNYFYQFGFTGGGKP